MRKKFNDDKKSLESIKHALTQYCSKSEKCKNDILKKMQPWSLTDEEKEAIIQYLEREGYLNEQRYASAFASDKLRFDRWGKIKIYHALRAKHIAEATIQNALNEIDEDTYLQILTDEVRKKMKSLHPSLDPYAKKMKLLQFGYQRGFEREYLEQVIDSML
jgi:regulatory protein